MFNTSKISKSTRTIPLSYYLIHMCFLCVRLMRAFFAYFQCDDVYGVVVA